MTLYRNAGIGAVEARQYRLGYQNQFMQWCGATPSTQHKYELKIKLKVANTADNYGEVFFLLPGDWVIKREDCFYVVPESTFRLMFDKV